MFGKKREAKSPGNENTNINASTENIDVKIDKIDIEENVTEESCNEENVNEVNGDFEERSNDEENTEIKRTDSELSDIAMGFYNAYTDSALGEIRRGYTEKSSDSLTFSKKKTLSSLYKRMEVDERGFNEDEIKKMLGFIDSKMYRYDILDDLIADDAISDIKLYSHDNIRIKRRGVRGEAGVSFKSDKEYRDFVTRILERNNINFGTANANQTFTDDTQDRAILRISCISELLTDSKKPCVALRKIQKEKRTLHELEERGMFDIVRRPKESVASRINAENFLASNEELGKLIPDIVESRGVIFTGKGASGKTTFMNALAELIPHDESVMISQENSEMFIEGHPDCLGVHVLTNKGDSKISYGLSSLTRMGLLIDLDRIIVGEIKQPDEAEGLSKASLTGHKCWTSVHGESCIMGLNKMADYICQANPNYTFANALNQLQGFEYVVHLSNFQVDEILKIDGWDYDKNCLITQCVYKID